MKQKTLIFYSQLLLAPIIMCAHIGLADAAVAQRATVKRAPTAAPATRPTVATKAAEPVVESESAIESEPEVVIQDKSSQFSTTSSFTNESDNDSILAEKIRAQRAAIDARDNRNTATAQIKSTASVTSATNITLGDSTRYVKIRFYPSSSAVYPVTYKNLMVTIGSEFEPYTRYNGGTILLCENGRKRTVPEIYVSASTTLVFNGTSVSLSSGTHLVPEFEFKYGINSIKVSTGTIGSTITVTYQEGEL